MTKQIKAKIPESWSIEVEETAHLDNEVLVFTDSNTNQKIYVKLCKPEDIQKGLIFEFVDPSQLRELGVSETVIEESYNTTLLRKSQVREQFIEESEQGKMSDVEYENWKKEQQRLLAEQKQKASNLTININTDKKPTEGEGTEEKEPFDLEAKQIEIFKQFNDERVFDAKTKEELVSFTTNLVNEGLEAKKPKPETPSGTMPLNDAQIKSYVQKQGEFASEAELIADLRKREQSGDVNAKRILGILYTKMAKGLRTKQVEFEADEDDQPTLKEICKKHKREDD